jgi:hypothetical protein
VGTAARGVVDSGCAAAATPAGTAHRELVHRQPPHPDEVVDRRLDDVALQARPHGDLVQRRCALLQRVENGPERSRATHVTSRPNWNTSVARIHAVPSCIEMPNSVHFTPISRFCAASVATQGV